MTYKDKASYASSPPYTDRANRISLSALYTMKRALYPMERALFPIKRALYYIKRALYPVERDLFPMKRAPSICWYIIGCNNGIGGFHENLVTFWGTKLPGFS